MNEQDRQLEEIEANEAWLAGFKTPAPSLDAVNRAKQAVHREAARLYGATAARSWRPWQGTLAAAAAIALCVTVSWFTIQRQSVEPQLIAEAEVKQMWPETTRNETTVLAAMDEQFSDLEDFSSEQRWSAGGAAMYHALEEALQDDSTSQPSHGGQKTGRTQG